MSNAKHASRALIVAVSLTVAPVAAVTIEIDYSYDTSSFFGAGNPQGTTGGMQARNALEAAAEFYSDILDDTLAQIATPPPFNSGPGDGRVTWSWTLSFFHPSDPDPQERVTLTDEFVPADVFRIYVGAEGLAGNTLGMVNGTGWSVTPDVRCCFTPQENEQAMAINDAFVAAVFNRGEPEDEYAAWGGAISFDNDDSTNWYFNHQTSTPSGKSNFYSVALHEIGHTLGIGFGDVWNGLVNASYFTGAAAVAENGGQVPLRCQSGQCDHWAEGTQSETYLTSVPQEALLDPTLSTGIRKILTKLDAAALTDLGWEVADAPDPPQLAGDYNGDNRVTAADFIVWRNTQGDTGPNLPADGNHNNDIDEGDYTVWRNNFGAVGSGGSLTASVPEPGSLSLVACVVTILIARPLNRARPGGARFSGRRDSLTRPDTACRARPA